MGRFALCVLVLAALAIGAAAIATADVPSVVAAQGRLTDDAGAPLPAGDKAFTFRIYDDAAAGTKVWPSGAGELQTIATTADGSWSASIGAVEPLSGSVFDGTDRWLEIEVDGTILPRLRLVTGPYAFRVATVDAADGGRLNTALEAPQLNLGNMSQDGLAQLYRNTSIAPTIVFNGGEPGGGSILVRDELGDPFLNIRPDDNGTGGYLSMNRAPSIEGFYVDANADGTGEPRVGVSGSARSVVLDMSQTGDNAVSLPPDAIASAEVFDEPGVASSDRHSDALLNPGVNSLLSRTLTAPTDGYVLAIATGEVILGHANGVASSAVFGISNQPGAFLAIQNITQLPATAPSGSWKIALAVQTVFPVAAGPTTFYVLGERVGGTIRASDLELSLLFVPTAYGDVDPLAASKSILDPGDAHVPETVRAETEGFHPQSIEREMAAMKAEIEDLKAQMAVLRGGSEPPQ